MKGNKITVIGSSNIDFLMKMEQLPKLGETVTDAEFKQVYGGKGANQAVAAARSGGNVSFVSCVGDDDLSPGFTQAMKNDGINLDYLFREKGISTGTAFIMIGEQGHNYISVAPGANYRLTPHYIDQLDDLIQQSAVIILQFEIPADTIQHIILKANTYDTPIVWNFAPAKKFEMKNLQYVDYLMANETETEFLTGLPVNDDDEIKRAAAKLLDMGVKTVIMTLGSRGAYFKNIQEEGFIDGYHVDAVDTTAAGDVFSGSFTSAIVEGKSMAEALRFANAAAAVSVTRLGAMPSAPTRKEIEDFLVKQQ